MKSNGASPMPPKLSSKPISLAVAGMHIVAFKNHKRAILDKNSGKFRTLTDAQAAQQMQQIVDSFVAQLLSVSQTTDGATSMEQRQQFLIASLPQDDSWQHIPELILKGRKVPKGQEGCEITIEIMEAL